MTRSKALKSLALLEAQAAVKFDNEGLVLDALEAYGKAVTLLEMVMKSTTSPEEYDRLLAIVSSQYKFTFLGFVCTFVPCWGDRSGKEEKRKGKGARVRQKQKSETNGRYTDRS